MPRAKKERLFWCFWRQTRNVGICHRQRPHEGVKGFLFPLVVKIKKESKRKKDRNWPVWKSNGVRDGIEKGLEAHQRGEKKKRRRGEEGEKKGFIERHRSRGSGDTAVVNDWLWPGCFRIGAQQSSQRLLSHWAWVQGIVYYCRILYLYSPAVIPDYIIQPWRECCRACCRACCTVRVEHWHLLRVHRTCGSHTPPTPITNHKKPWGCIIQGHSCHSLIGEILSIHRPETSRKGPRKKKKKRRKRNVFDDVRWAPAPLQLED